MEDIARQSETEPSKYSPPPTGHITRTRRWLVERGYWPLWHLLAVIVIIGFACLLFYQHFRTSGTLLHVDMNFPLTVDRIAGQVTNTWLQYSGFQTISFILMAPWTLAYVLLAKIFHLSRSGYLLVMVISTFSMAGIFMYALAFSTMRSIKALSKAKVALLTGSVLAAVIYMYNPYSLFQLWPFMMYVAYAVMPLMFILLRKIFEAPRARHIIVFVFLISVCSTHPTCVSWIWTMIVAYSIYFLLIKRFAWRSLVTTAKVIFSSLGLYLIVNAAWTVPYAAAKLNGIPMGPNYAPFFDQASLDGLSSTCTLSNNLRLTSGYGQFTIPGADNVLSILLSFALPILVLVCLVLLGKQLQKNSTFLFWGMLSVILLLFVTGSSFILRRFYSYMVLRAPGSGSYGWIFRSPNRMLFAVPLFYGLAIGILVAWLLRGVPRSAGSSGEEIKLPDDRYPKERDDAGSELIKENIELRTRLGRYDRMLDDIKHYASVSVALLILAVILLAFYPRAKFYSQFIFDPTKVPGDYETVNNYIETRIGPDGIIMWMPFISLDHMIYDWAPSKRIPPVNVYSGNPCLDNLQEIYDTDSYFNWITELLQKEQLTSVQMENKDVTVADDIAAKLFVPFAAQYMIFDSSKMGYKFDDYFDTDKSLKKKLQTDILKVYKTSYNPPLIRVARKTVKANSFFDNLAISQRFPAEMLGEIAFVNGKTMTPSFSSIEKKYGLIDIDNYKDYVPINSGFEEGVAGTGTVPNWQPSPDNPSSVQVVMDGSKSHDGQSSLKVINGSTEQFSIGWVYGTRIPVAQGDVYSFDTSIQLRNANWSAAGVEGFQDSTGNWIKLVDCPSVQAGTTGWKNYQCSFYIPPGISAIRPTLAGGWVEEQKDGPAVTWFDDVKISRINDSFYSDLFSDQAQPKVTFEKKSAEKYIVHVKGAKGPFVLVFGEAFDPFWAARMPDGTKIAPAPLYSSINGFQIDKKGNYDVIIEYPPQSWYYTGLIVSIPVILACILFLIIDWIKRREERGSRIAISVMSAAKKLREKASEYFQAPPRRGVKRKGDSHEWR